MSSTGTPASPTDGTSTGPTSSAATGTITTTFQRAGETWTVVYDADHSTTLAVFDQGVSVDLASTMSPPPRPSNNPNNNNNNNGQGFQGNPGTAPSSLYLLTFAITLSLLLSISLAILLRNLVLRMRERRIREAVAAGLLPPESLGWIYRAQLGILSVARTRAADAAGSHTPRVIGPKPSLWDAWVPDTEKGLASKGMHAVEPSWEGVVPLSLTPLAAAPATSSATPAPAAVELPRRNLLEILFQLPPMPHIPQRPPSTTQPVLNEVDSAEAERQRQERLIAELFEPASSRVVTSADATTPSDAAAPSAAHGVRVALFVAMPRDPALGRPQQRNEEDPLDGLDIVLGTSDVVFDRQRTQPGTPATPSSPIASTSGQL